MKVGDCRYGAGLAFMDITCKIACWKNGHWAYVTIASVLLLIFIPVQLLQAHIWQVRIK